MDDLTFTFVSAAAALGGALGTAVGYKKLLQDREFTKASIEKKVHENNPIENSPNVSMRTEQNVNKAMLYATDFTRTIGYLGYHSVYGMVVYPWMPLYSLGGMLKKDAELRK